MLNSKHSPKILVFSTDKISDPGIDQAGLQKIHYSPSVYVISVPCSSSIKPKWIMHAFDKGFDGVFIAADGEECAYSSNCPEMTNQLIVDAQQQMKKNNVSPKRIRMAAICSVCADPFSKHIANFSKILSSIEDNEYKVPAED
jgi:coenzyme F420-reducing hydrogenase delta subunit